MGSQHCLPSWSNYVLTLACSSSNISQPESQQAKPYYTIHAWTYGAHTYVHTYVRKSVAFLRAGSLNKHGVVVIWKKVCSYYRMEQTVFPEEDSSADWLWGDWLQRPVRNMQDRARNEPVACLRNKKPFFSFIHGDSFQLPPPHAYRALPFNPALDFGTKLFHAFSFFIHFSFSRKVFCQTTLYILESIQTSLWALFSQECALRTSLPKGFICKIMKKERLGGRGHLQSSQVKQWNLKNCN